jgi:hypothetical protein
MSMQVAPTVNATTKQVIYLDDEKKAAVEACHRYGIRPTVRLLAELWPGRNPSRQTLQAWAHAIVPDPQAQQYWDIHEATHQQRLTEMFAQRLPAILDSVDRLCGQRHRGEEHGDRRGHLLRQGCAAEVGRRRLRRDISTSTPTPAGQVLGVVL